MSILSYHDINNAIREKSIIIDPFDPQCLGTNSYDVHLARTLLTYKPAYGPIDPSSPLAWLKPASLPLDCKVERETVETVIADNGFVLMPGELYLAATVEYTETHEHVPFLEGKSSLGRLGLNIHVTAGKGDVGFCGHWTMEMTVVKPLRIYAGMPIGQLIYHQVSRKPIVDYASKPSQKYAAQHTRSDNPKPVASRMWKNFPDGLPLLRKA